MWYSLVIVDGRKKSELFTSKRVASKYVVFMISINLIKY